MPNCVIQADGIIKEAFDYERALTEASEYALTQYAKATYGAHAQARRATARESAQIMLHGPESLVGKPVMKPQ